jgi:hypothetical protein
MSIDNESLVGFVFAKSRFSEFLVTKLTKKEYHKMNIVTYQLTTMVGPGQSTLGVEAPGF